MHHTPRISRTKQLKQLLVISRTDDKATARTSANIPASISAAAGLITALISFAAVLVAVYAFLVSCFYVKRISEAFHYNISEYLTLLDYLQFFPPVLALHKGTFALVWSWSLILICITTATVVVLFVVRYDEEDSPTFRFIKRTVVPNVLSLLFLVVLLITARFHVTLVVDIYTNAGRELREDLRQRSVSIVSRRNDLPSVQGKPFLQTSRYLLLFASQDDSLIAIPQAEVSLITTPLKSLSASATVAPATTATPSQTSATSPKPN